MLLDIIVFFFGLAKQHHKSKPVGRVRQGCVQTVQTAQSWKENRNNGEEFQMLLLTQSIFSSKIMEVENYPNLEETHLPPGAIFHLHQCKAGQCARSKTGKGSSNWGLAQIISSRRWLNVAHGASRKQRYVTRFVRDYPTIALSRLPF